MLYNINSSGLVVLLCLSVCMYVCVCVSLLFPWQRFTKLFILVSLFSPLATPPCITAFRLLRSLSLSFLIDTQQPTSLNCVFYAPWFSALSSSLMFPFLGWLNDVSICCLFTSSTSQSSLFIHTYVTVRAYETSCIACVVHECMLKFRMHQKSSPHLCPRDMSLFSLFSTIFKRIAIHPRNHIWHLVVRTIIPCLNIML